MADFSNGSVFRLSPCAPGDVERSIAPLLIEGERIVLASNAAGTSSSSPAGA